MLYRTVGFVPPKVQASKSVALFFGSRVPYRSYHGTLGFVEATVLPCNKLKDLSFLYSRTPKFAVFPAVILDLRFEPSTQSILNYLDHTSFCLSVSYISIEFHI